MTVDVYISVILREAAGGERTVRSDADTVAALIDELDARHPGFADQIRTPDGVVRDSVVVSVNGESIRSVLDTPLQPGDSVYLLSAIAGG